MIDCCFDVGRDLVSVEFPVSVRLACDHSLSQKQKRKKKEEEELIAGS